MRSEIAPRRPSTSLSEAEARRGVIRHVIPRGVLMGTDDASPGRPCVWCGEPTKITAETPFRPDLGALPLMVTCGAEMRAAWRAIGEGTPLDPALKETLVRFITRLAR